MIQLTDLKRLSSLVEEENHAFRLYLKQHADPDQLDKEFLKLHNEVFKVYDCSTCMNCCKEYSANFSFDEIKPAADLLDLTPDKFMSKYIDTSHGLNAKNIPCDFLSEKNVCSLVDHKPLSCREYPFTNKPNRISSLISLVESTKVCPAVYEIFESLKGIYSYRRRRN